MQEYSLRLMDILVRHSTRDTPRSHERQVNASFRDRQAIASALHRHRHQQSYSRIGDKSAEVATRDG